MGRSSLGTYLGWQSPVKRKQRIKCWYVRLGTSGCITVRKSASRPDSMLSIICTIFCIMTPRLKAWLQSGISRQDAIAAIKSDYDSNYFVSGKGWLH